MIVRPQNVQHLYIEHKPPSSSEDECGLRFRDVGKIIAVGGLHVHGDAVRGMGALLAGRLAPLVNVATTRIEEAAE